MGKHTDSKYRKKTRKDPALLICRMNILERVQGQYWVVLRGGYLAPCVTHLEMVFRAQAEIPQDAEVVLVHHRITGGCLRNALRALEAAERKPFKIIRVPGGEKEKEDE